MFSCLRADFFRLFRTVSFWVCGAISALLGAVMGNAITGYATWAHSTYPPEEWTEAKNIFVGYIHSDTFSLFPNLMLIGALLVGIVIIMFVSKEFSTGIIKNNASKGLARGSLFFSKLVITLFTYFLYLAISISTALFVCKTSISGLGLDNVFFKFPPHQIDAYIIRGIAGLIMVIIALSLATVIRSLGPTLAIFIVWIMGEGIVMHYLSEWLTKMFKLKEELNLSLYTLSGVAYDGKHLVRVGYVLGAFALVAIVGGWYAFQKRDIN